MKSFILPPLLISSLCSGQINNAGTLNNEVRTRKFVQLLDRAGISPSIGKTIFAPSTDAWQDYREEDVDQWNKYAQQAEFFVHMREILLWHFVTEDKFTFTQIFNGNREFLQVRNGNITVYQGNGPNRKIDNVPATAFLERDIVTSDGMVHILSDVIVPPFLNQRLLEQLLDDQSATFAFSTWANLALWAGLDDHINGVYERGITLLVPPNRRFNRAEIDVPGLLTPEMRDYTRDLVLCHMIMDNYHEAGIFAMSESLLTDQHLVLSELGTHMWITTTGKGSDLGSQRVRFQSTEVLVFDQVAKNGLVLLCRICTGASGRLFSTLFFFLFLVVLLLQHLSCFGFCPKATLNFRFCRVHGLLDVLRNWRLFPFLPCYSFEQRRYFENV